MEQQLTHRTDTLILMLMGIVILLMIAIVGLFWNMTQMQRAILSALDTVPTSGNSASNTGLELDTPAPEFELTDTSGRFVALSDFAGRQVLLVLSAPTCSACIKLYPHLQEFNQRHSDIQMLMISFGDEEVTRKAYDKEGFNFPVLHGTKDTAEKYQLEFTPFLYLINSGGNIEKKGISQTIDDLELLAGIG